jgi:hypothetical protein
MASPFLDLPEELRDMVFEYPTHVHCYTGKSSGFLLSFKQVYQEYETKARQSMKTVLSTGASGWSSIYHIAIHFSLVATIAAQRRMSARLSRSRYPGAENLEDSSPGVLSRLEPVSLLHLEQVELGLYTDDKAWDMPQYQRRSKLATWPNAQSRPTIAQFEIWRYHVGTLA